MTSTWSKAATQKWKIIVWFLCNPESLQLVSAPISSICRLSTLNKSLEPIIHKLKSLVTSVYFRLVWVAKRNVNLIKTLGKHSEVKHSGIVWIDAVFWIYSVCVSDCERMCEREEDEVKVIALCRLCVFCPHTLHAPANGHKLEFPHWENTSIR